MSSRDKIEAVLDTACLMKHDVKVVLRDGRSISGIPTRDDDVYTVIGSIQSIKFRKSDVLDVNHEHVPGVVKGKRHA